VPDNPAAWLHTTARYLAVDRIRKRDTQRSKVRLAAATSPRVVECDFAELVDGDLAGDLLGLIFMAGHPILSPDARSALTLKLICGLDTSDIARAFLVPGPTIAQRVVRAKRTLSAANIRFELPGPAELPGRLAACVRSYISSSTRGTRLPAGTRGCAPTCARRRCGWAGCWPA
jgi:RNA polymerase sigma-70 factor, ECF subfamily